MKKNLKEGIYYVNLVYPGFRSVIDDEDFTDMVSDFSKFSYLGIDVTGDTIRLINTPDKGFIFVRYPLSNGKFIRANEILKIKDEQGDKNMNKEKIKVTSAEIIVTGDPKNPYYEIKYLGVGDNEYTIGFGSCDLKIVTRWYNNCFEIVTEELTPAERIRRLEEEKATLELQIKNQAKYDRIRKVCDDFALAVQALQDSGFSRDEAMQLFMMSNMSIMIPQFLKR